MLAGELVHIMRNVRLRAPKTIRSALAALEGALENLFGVRACVFEIPSEKTLYITRWPGGLNKKKLAVTLGLSNTENYRWVVLDVEDHNKAEETLEEGFSVLRVPLFMEKDGFAVLSMIKRNKNAFRDVDHETFAALSEVVSFILLPFAVTKHPAEGGNREESLRIELLEAVGDELMMRGVMLRMTELSQAEFCAFYTKSDESYFYVMLDGKELSPRIPEIRTKLRTAYGMFMNSHDENEILHEKVYVRRRESNVAYLLGSSKIESYFLIPVTYDARVRGVLFFGSVQKDAFVSENIATFRRLADETNEKIPLVFRVGGEIGIMERILDILPFGGALISHDGRIVCANGAFGKTLDMHGTHPETIKGVSGESPFNLHGVWDEFRVLQRDIVDRELLDVTARNRALAVTWLRLENLEEDVDSLVLVKDVTPEKERDEAREEMLATVAHELRTPMTALRNSLKIMMEHSPCVETEDERDGYRDHAAGGRFLRTAYRTADRLNMLVDGIVNISNSSIPDRPLNLEEVDVKSFIEEASILFLESMKKRDIQFETSIDHTVSTLVFDRDRMEQVMQNLLSNSLKNVPSGGKISISVAPCSDLTESAIPPVPWEYVGSPRLVRMRVSDTGGGFTDDTVDEMNLLSGVERGKRRPTRGLGLYISSYLMRRHGGSLVIERGVGIETSVCLFLPAEARTAGIIRTVRMIEGIIDGMTGKGLNTVLYSIVKNGSKGWTEITDGWLESPVFNPEKEGFHDKGLYLWTLGKNFAHALTVEERMVEDPMVIMPLNQVFLPSKGGYAADAVRIGWAVAPGDGKSYAELAAVSIEKIGIESVKAVEKGVSG